MTTNEAADLLGVTPSRIKALIKSGKLKATKIGRDWQIERKSVTARKNGRRPIRP